MAPVRPTDSWCQIGRKLLFRRSERSCYVGRVGLEPKRVTPLTCDDTEMADIVTRFHPAASRSIRLEREPCSERCTGTR